MSESLASSLAPFHALLEDLVEERTERALGRAISSHRAGTLSPQDALSLVATLSELRLLLSDLESKTRRFTQ